MGKLWSQWRYTASSVANALSLRALLSLSLSACDTPFSCGQAHVMKAMRSPSGNHLKSTTPVGTSPARLASPPSGGIR